MHVAAVYKYSGWDISAHPTQVWMSKEGEM